MVLLSSSGLSCFVRRGPFRGSGACPPRHVAIRGTLSRGGGQQRVEPLLETRAANSCARRRGLDVSLCQRRRANRHWHPTTALEKLSVGGGPRSCKYPGPGLINGIAVVSARVQRFELHTLEVMPQAIRQGTLRELGARDPRVEIGAVGSS